MRERSADAGEPAGTAGVPILQVLRGAGLADVMAVVVRWFGGTKLGKGGLARAYAASVQGELIAVTDDLPRRLRHQAEEVVQRLGRGHGEGGRLMRRLIRCNIRCLSPRFSAG